MVDVKPYSMSHKNENDYEERKVPVARVDRYDNKFEKAKQHSYITPNMIGMVKQTAEVPQKSRHMMKFCLGEKDNKLLNRDVKISDHLDMYTTKVNNTNARVNLDMQSRRAVGYPSFGQASPTAGAFPGSSNLLVQRHGRDNLIRAPFMWQ
jgi:uncharacterized protein YwqG